MVFLDGSKVWKFGQLFCGLFEWQSCCCCCCCCLLLLLLCESVSAVKPTLSDYEMRHNSIRVESPVHRSLRLVPPLPSALINECLWDAALKLSLPSLFCVHFSSVSLLTSSLSEVLHWYDRRKAGQARAAAGHGDTVTGNKSVIFHLVYKQVVMLRWAIAYYGLGPACDISKQSSTALCEPMRSVF